MNYLLDSDCIADYLNGHRSATTLYSGFYNNDLAMSVISYGEIYEGVYYGRGRERHELGPEKLLEIVAVIDVNQESARQFAVVSGDLRKQSLLIPAPDVLMAATAFQSNRALVTRNLKHFGRNAGLSILDANK